MEEDRIISYKTEFMTKSYGKIYQYKQNVSITPTDVYNLYPVGSIYLSVNNTNPSNFFGGTWEKIAGGKYLFGVGGEDGNVAPGSTGGAWGHTHSLDTNSAVAAIQLNNKGSIWYNERNTGTNNTKNYTLTTSGTGAPQTNSSPYGAKLFGNTASTQVIPPYYAVYIWKRVA